MEKFTITAEERKILELQLPPEEERGELFESCYPESSAFDDVGEYYTAKNAFSKGMMLLQYLHNTDQVREISKDGTILLLQQEVITLQEKFIEEKKVFKETLQKLKDDANSRMRRLEEQQHQDHEKMNHEMNKKIKLSLTWMIGGCIAVVVAIAEFVYISTKL